MFTKRAWTFIGLVAAAIAMVLTLVGVGYLISKQQISSEIGLPILAIAGLILLLATLSAMAMVFVWLGVENEEQALALPEGSIRSVIALSLIVLFGIFGFYLYGSMAEDNKINKVDHVSAAEIDAVLKALGDRFLFKVEDTCEKVCGDRGKDAAAPTPPDAGKPAETAPPPNPPAPQPTYTLFFKSFHNQSSDEFAKQIMTVLGTLVTAISAFYFGAQSVQTATNAMKGDDGAPPEAAPKPKAISPSDILKGTEQKLSVAGSNLEGVDKVVFRSGTTEVSADITQATATSVSVTAKFADTQTGTWDVVVRAGTKSATLLGALTVK